MRFVSLLSLALILFWTAYLQKKYGAIFGAGQISTIQSLVGQTGRRWVMGVISQLEDGHFYLEDLAASVEIDLSKAISFAFNALAIIFQT